MKNESTWENDENVNFYAVLKLLGLVLKMKIIYVGTA